MSDGLPLRNSTRQAVYVNWILILVGTALCLQFLIPIGLYRAWYGVPSFGDLLLDESVDFSHATIWKDRIWYPLTKVGLDHSPVSFSLISVDPRTGEFSESSFQVPLTTAGLLPDGDRLWSVSAHSVTRIEENQVVEYLPQRPLNHPSEPFLYDHKLAVIDILQEGDASLLVLENQEWFEVGRLRLPDFAGVAANSGDLPQRDPLVGEEGGRNKTSLDVRVIVSGNQTHFFCCDGNVILYRQGVPLDLASALVPANGPQSGSSDTLNWEVVRTDINRFGVDRNHLYRVGLIHENPAVFIVNRDSADSGREMKLQTVRRIGGYWQQTAESPIAGTGDLIVLSDGRTTYLANQNLSGPFQFEEITESSIQPWGAVIKGLGTPLQQPLERWGNLTQWVFWPLLLVLTLAVGIVMQRFRDAKYQVGIIKVELASVTRRGIARVIDCLVYVVPLYLLFRVGGLSSQDQIADEFQHLLLGGTDEFFARFLWLLGGSIVLVFSILVLNSIFQGAWGVTVGKWVCGIRTVRTTLKPCGFLRSVLREFLILADTLFMVTWLPVTLLIALTDFRQRVGDFAADTIVIRRS